MSNAEASYKNELGLDLNLFLDIDLKTHSILDFYWIISLCEVQHHGWAS